jgi:hypothetical protein
MRNRNLIDRKLSILEGSLVNLQRIVQTREPIQTYKDTIAQALETLDDLRGMVEAEPMSPGEMNKV